MAIDCLSLDFQRNQGVVNEDLMMQFPLGDKNNDKQMLYLEYVDECKAMIVGAYVPRTKEVK